MFDCEPAQYGTKSKAIIASIQEWYTQSYPSPARTGSEVLEVLATRESGKALAEARFSGIVTSKDHIVSTKRNVARLMYRGERLLDMLASQRFGVRGRRFHPVDVMDWIRRGIPTKVS